MYSVACQGVGEWKEINYYEFSDKAVRFFEQHVSLLTDLNDRFVNINMKNTVELELRTCILLGVNDITEYFGNKIKETEQEEIKKNNIAKGKKENKLKDNIYLKLSISS